MMRARNLTKCDRFWQNSTLPWWRRADSNGAAMIEMLSQDYSLWSFLIWMVGMLK